MTDPVCVTGCGVVSALGESVAEFWHNMIDDAVAAPEVVRGFDANRYRVGIAHEVPGAGERMERASSFAARAAREAATSAGLDPWRRRTGLALATTSCGWITGQALACDYAQDGGEAFARHPHASGDHARDAAAHAVVAELGINGPLATPSAACAASAHAIAWAAGQVASGAADAMLAGGVDVLTELVYAGFHSVRALAPDACRPFSRDRRGLVLGEGAALLVLERRSSAAARGATVLAEISGCALTTDTRDMTNPSAVAIERTMTAALKDADCPVDRLDSISAHGTGTRANDTAEAQAIAELLGDATRSTPVCAIKSSIGHTQGVAAAFGCVAAVLTLTTRCRPPLRNFLGPDPELPALRFAAPDDHPAQRPRAILVNAFGFGGATSSVVISTEGPRAVRRRARARFPVRVAGAAAMVARLARERRTSRWMPSVQLTEEVDITDAGSPDDLVLQATRRLLARHGGRGPAASCGSYLGTFYGSQRIHERSAVALSETGPAGYKPRDFAVSTYNAPAGRAAMVSGLRGPTTAWLGMNGGLAAIGAAAELVASGRCERMIAGGYDLPTAMLAELLHRSLAVHAKGAIALLELTARDNEPAVADIVSHASVASSSRWPGPHDFALALERSEPRQGTGQARLHAIVIDPTPVLRDAQLAAIAGCSLARGAAVIDAALHYGGHHLAASAPLGALLALEAADAGAFPESCVIDGDAELVPGNTVVVLAGGWMTGVDVMRIGLA